MIRKAELDDASRLAEILIFAKRTAYRQIFNDDHVSFNEMQVLDLALEFRDKESKLENLYVYDDGIVKGMINWEISDREDPNSPIEIFELYTDTFFQGQGVGSVLLDNCIEHAKKHACKKIILWVLEKNYPARTFYEKHQFTAEGASKFEEGTTEIILKYQLEI